MDLFSIPRPFLATPLSDSDRRHIISASDDFSKQDKEGTVNWSKEKDLHITMIFIDSIDLLLLKFGDR